MPKARKPPQPKPQQLLVEGKNDRHVIWALCQQYQLPETFSVEVPPEEGTEGVEALLSCHAFKLHIQGGLDGPPHKTPNCLLTFYLNAQQLTI